MTAIAIYVEGGGDTPHQKAALRVGLDAHDPWADPALATYARAARVTPALCEPLATFKVAGDVPTCRR